MRNQLVQFLALMCFVGLSFAEEKTLTEVQKDFQKSDARLNQIYQRILVKIEGAEEAEFRKMQRDWITYRDYIAEWQAEDQDQKAKSLAYWEMMKGLSDEQIEILKVWPGVPQKDEWSGSYTDGRGGHLTLKRDGKKLRFQITVVRGPTFHIGQIEGEAKINKFTARFATQVEMGEGEEDEEAWLTFKQAGPYMIEIEGENTSSFHGARAFFDGSYRRLSVEAKFED